MPLITRNRIARALQIALVVAAAFFAVAYLYVALARLTYPYELQWMEGESLVQLRRLLAGQLLFVRPSFNYVPMIYQPLYFYMARLVAEIAGDSFVALRAVSIFASLGCAALIYLLVKHETGRAWVSWTAASLWLATFQVSGAWFDIGRVDTLLLWWLLLALYLMRRNTLAAWVGASAALALAFFTKQTAFVVAVPLTGYALLTDRRGAVVMILSGLTFVGVGGLVLNALHGGWYFFYTLELPRQHVLAVSLEEIVSFWMVDLFAALPVVVVMALGVLLSRRISQFDRRTWLLYWASTLGMLSVSFMGRLNPGGYVNNLFPAYAMLSILFGIGLGRAVMLPLTNTRLAWIRFGVCVACLCQFAALIYPIPNQIPTPEDRLAGQQFVERLRQISGDVYIPYHTYLAVLAGKPGFAHQVALAELQGDFGGAAQEMLANVRAEFKQAVQTQQFAAVVLDVPGWLESDLAPTYELIPEAAFEDERVFWPVTDWRIRPTLWYARSAQP